MIISVLWLYGGLSKLWNIFSWKKTVKLKRMHKLYQQWGYTKKKKHLNADSKQKTQSSHTVCDSKVTSLNFVTAFTVQNRANIQTLNFDLLVFFVLNLYSDVLDTVCIQTFNYYYQDFRLNIA